MSKEFEDKKQEIADHIEHSFRLMIGSPKMDNTHKYVIKSVDAQKLVSMINDLQPPKPPTCATCDYLTGGRCEIGVTDRWLEAGDGFGCLHHSDYEVAE